MGQIKVSPTGQDEFDYEVCGKVVGHLKQSTPQLGPNPQPEWVLSSKGGADFGTVASTGDATPAQAAANFAAWLQKYISQEKPSWAECEDDDDHIRPASRSSE